MAQDYPTRPIAMIIPHPPGGSTDVIGRLLAERMRGLLGQPIVIENVSGANWSIGTGTLTANEWYDDQCFSHHPVHGSIRGYARPFLQTIDLLNLSTVSGGHSFRQLM
jgi:hypothetical protein